ncbi:hypothetical protein DFJ74DRAFT_481977 [Hyaloraphidium curvatum]|nr:hypothetical protein DFJ74DRAFT_481977 [Hyaloraphidium curvatum]
MLHSPHESRRPPVFTKAALMRDSEMSETGVLPANHGLRALVSPGAAPKQQPTRNPAVALPFTPATGGERQKPRRTPSGRELAHSQPAPPRSHTRSPSMDSHWPPSATKSPFIALQEENALLRQKLAKQEELLLAAVGVIGNLESETELLRSVVQRLSNELEAAMASESRPLEVAPPAAELEVPLPEPPEIEETTGAGLAEPSFDLDAVPPPEEEESISIAVEIAGEDATTDARRPSEPLPEPDGLEAEVGVESFGFTDSDRTPAVQEPVVLEPFGFMLSDQVPEAEVPEAREPEAQEPDAVEPTENGDWQLDSPPVVMVEEAVEGGSEEVADIGAEEMPAGLEEESLRVDDESVRSFGEVYELWTPDHVDVEMFGSLSLATESKTIEAAVVAKVSETEEASAIAGSGMVVMEDNVVEAEMVSQEVEVSAVIEDEGSVHVQDSAAVDLSFEVAGMTQPENLLDETQPDFLVEPSFDASVADRTVLSALDSLFVAQGGPDADDADFDPGMLLDSLSPFERLPSVPSFPLDLPTDLPRAPDHEPVSRGPTPQSSPQRRGSTASANGVPRPDSPVKNPSPTRSFAKTATMVTKIKTRLGV